MGLCDLFWLSGMEVEQGEPFFSPVLCDSRSCVFKLSYSYGTDVFHSSGSGNCMGSALLSGIGRFGIQAGIFPCLRLEAEACPFYPASVSFWNTLCAFPYMGLWDLSGICSCGADAVSHLLSASFFVE